MTFFSFYLFSTETIIFESGRQFCRTFLGCLKYIPDYYNFSGMFFVISFGFSLDSRILTKMSSGLCKDPCKNLLQLFQNFLWWFLKEFHHQQFLHDFSSIDFSKDSDWNSVYVSQGSFPDLFFRNFPDNSSKNSS